MSYALSRLMSTASATYGGYALADPRHLGRNLVSDKEAPDYDVLAQTYGARDLAISAFGIFGKSSRTVTTAMLVRIAFDVSDAIILSGRAKDEETRNKILGITLGWAGLNTLALLIDRRKSD